MHVVTSATDLKKEATAEIHTKVENLPFMQNLLNKTVTKERYVQYLANLKPIYTALEEGLTKNKLLPYIEPLYIPDLFRLKPIEDDLAFFEGTNIPPSFEAKQHAEHIKDISENNPHLLIAHAYTRYLGDLFGGQDLYTRVEELWGENSTKFYQFEELLEKYSIDGIKVFAAQVYRKLLCKLPLSPQQADKVVVEALEAFKYADEMIKEI